MVRRLAVAVAAVALLAGCADVPQPVVTPPDTPTPVPPPSPTPSPPVVVPGGTGTQVLVAASGGVLLAAPDGRFRQIVEPGAGVRLAVDDGVGGVVLDVPGRGVVRIAPGGEAVEPLVTGPGVVLFDAGVLMGEVYVAYSTTDRESGQSIAWLHRIGGGEPVALGQPDVPVVAMSIGRDLVLVSRQELRAEEVTAWTEVWDGFTSTTALAGVPGRNEACRPAAEACPWFVAISADGTSVVRVQDRRDPGDRPELTPAGEPITDVAVVDRSTGEVAVTVPVVGTSVSGVRSAADQLVVNVVTAAETGLEAGSALTRDLRDGEPVPVVVPGNAWQPSGEIEWRRPGPVTVAEVVDALTS